MTIEAFNQSLFLYINGNADAPVWMVHAAVGMADYLIGLVPLLLLGLWLWGGHAHRAAALKAFLVTLLCLAVNQAIGALWPHPRPFMIGLGHTWIPHAADASFPSDHMTVFAGIGLTLLFEGVTGWAVATLLIGLCVAWARVFLGVHFPLDMAGSVLVAGAVYASMTPLWRKFGEPIIHVAERLYRRLLARPIADGWIRH